MPRANTRYVDRICLSLFERRYARMSSALMAAAYPAASFRVRRRAVVEQELLEHALGLFVSLVHAAREGGAALRHGMLKQPPGGRRDEQGKHIDSTGRLTRNSDQVRVSAEAVDVPAYPFSGPG